MRATEVYALDVKHCTLVRQLVNRMGDQLRKKKPLRLERLCLRFAGLSNQSHHSVRTLAKRLKLT
jgi:hypothetical protein